MSDSKTLVHRIQHWANVRPSQAALHGKRDGRWERVTYAEYWGNVQAVGKALIQLGVKHGECVAIIGKNEPEWVQYEFGAEAVGAVPAPIYGTSTDAQVSYIFKDCGARVVVAGGEEELQKILHCEAAGLIDAPTAILTFAPVATRDPRVRSFEEVLALGDEGSQEEFDARFEALTPEDLSIMIYTSGTTGKPKGVEIDHGGQLLIGKGGQDFAPQFYDGRSEYHAVSYLPLSHQAEQILTNVFTLMVGGQAYFCPEIPLVKDYLAEVRPTIFLGVPRVWEKFEAALRARLGEASGLKAKLVDWGMNTEFRAFETQVRKGLRADQHQPIPRRIARALVVDKVKTALGLDRLEIAVTGSAPMSKSTQEFFASLGICIYEVYGLTETSGVATITDPKKPAFGTVGKPFRGVDIRIGDESEIQIKGRNVVRGYRGLAEETRAMLTEDGWLKTGDAGQFDRDGNIKITGRLKELIITAGGKNVAPVELEFYLQRIAGVGQAMVVGDRKPYLCALVTLDPENLETLAKNAGVTAANLETLASSEKVRAHLMREVEKECNAHVARYQTIKKISVLPREFDVELGELTASMKLRRKQILEGHHDRVEAMYAG